MREWLVGLGGEGFATAVFWVVVALILLFIVLVVVRIVRSMSAGTFVAGGRNRAPRLAVVDAAAVDNQRRLVLVRRDDVEHLILIGGPTDVVIEQRIEIRHAGAAMAGAQPSQRPVRRQEPAAPPVPQRPVENAPPRPQPAAPPAPAPSPEPRSSDQSSMQRDAPIAPPQRTEARESAPVPPAPPRQTVSVQQEQPLTARTSAGAAPVANRPEPTLPRADEIDTSFLEEPESATEERQVEAPEANPTPRQDISIEDEMSRLLDDLSDERQRK